MKYKLITTLLVLIYSITCAQNEPELLFQREITYGTSDSARIRVSNITAGNNDDVYISSIYINYLPSYRPYAVLKKLSGSNFDVDWEITDTSEVNHSLELVNNSVITNNSNNSFWWISDKGNLSIKNPTRNTLRSVNASDTSFNKIADLDLYSAHTYWKDKFVSGSRYTFENDSSVIRIRVIDKEGNETSVFDYTNESTLFCSNIVINGDNLYFLALKSSWWTDNQSPKLNLVKYDLEGEQLISETELYDSSSVSSYGQMNIDSNGNLTLAYTTRDTTIKMFRLNPNNEILWTNELKLNSEMMLRKVLTSEENNSLILLGYSPPFSSGGVSQRGTIIGVNLSNGSFAYNKEYNFKEVGDFHSFIRDGVITSSGNLVIVGEFVNEEGASKSQSYLAEFQLSEITSVEKEKGYNELTSSYSLAQNYPNPFNPTTTISFTIPTNHNDIIKLKVYDVLGKEVAFLVNEQKSAGNYKVDFDASNLSNGIYFYTLTTGNFRQTKKMLLIK